MAKKVLSRNNTLTRTQKIKDIQNLQLEFCDNGTQYTNKLIKQASKNDAMTCKMGIAIEKKDKVVENSMDFYLMKTVMNSPL